MEKIKQFASIDRPERLIYEEKIDGSNFCVEIKDAKLKFYSRKYEIELETCDDFFKKFIIYTNEMFGKFPNLSFMEGQKIFFEAIGQAHIKYKLGDTAHDKLFLIEMSFADGSWSTRRNREKLAISLQCNIAPLIEFEQLHNTTSLLDGVSLREGYIMKIEGGSPMVKFVENKFKESRGKDKEIEITFDEKVSMYNMRLQKLTKSLIYTKELIKNHGESDSLSKRKFGIEQGIRYVESNLINFMKKGDKND